MVDAIFFIVFFNAKEAVKIKNKKGFSLIEIMIVITIIGLLAAIAIPNYISYREKAYCSAMDIDIEVVMGAIADYFSDPTHITVSTNAINVTLGNNNPFSITPMTLNRYKIILMDGTGRCPRGSTTRVMF